MLFMFKQILTYHKTSNILHPHSCVTYSSSFEFPQCKTIDLYSYI